MDHFDTIVLGGPSVAQATSTRPTSATSAGPLPGRREPGEGVADVLRLPRPYWDQIGATIVGRHVFDMTDGWDGKPPGGVDHVVVVTHRPKPEGWDPGAPFHFVDGVVRVRQALLRVGPRAAPVGGSRRGDPGQPGPSPALSGAPLTDLSGYAKKSAADGDTRSGRRLRIAGPGPTR